MTDYTFGEVIKECNIRKLSIKQQHEYKVMMDNVSSDSEMSFYYDVAKEIGRNLLYCIYSVFLLIKLWKYKYY